MSKRERARARERESERVALVTVRLYLDLSPGAPVRHDSYPGTPIFLQFDIEQIYYKNVLILLVRMN